MSGQATATAADAGERTTWTREQVEELLRAERFEGNRIELPYGLRTGGRDHSATARSIFPADMTGRSVLDVGCGTGYFVFEALKRGAGPVLGVDVDRDSLRRARLLADCLGLEARFEPWDIERDPMDGRFDDVLCLNLLHHLKNPLAALDKLAELTHERLILEVATLGRHDRRRLKLSALAGRILSRAPVIYLGHGGIERRHQVKKFYMTAAAVRTLLTRHRNTFARVDILPSEHKGRFIAIAHKRRIGRLLVVAGPTAAGKTTLIERLRAGELPELAARVGAEDVGDWPKVGAKYAWRADEPVHERLLLHYDFLRPHGRSARTHERDEALELVGSSERVTALTVWTPPERLVRQITENEIDSRGFLTRRLRPPRRHLRIREDYRDPAKVIAYYRAWFSYIRERADEHLIVETGEPPRVYTLEEWEREVAPAYEARA